MFKESIFPFKTSLVTSSNPAEGNGDSVLPYLASLFVPDSPIEVVSSPFSLVPEGAISSVPHETLNSDSPIPSSTQSAADISDPSPSDFNQSIDHSPIHSEPYTRRSTRVKTPPAWLKDYICPPITNSTTNHLASNQPSQSHSFHSITNYPLFLSSHLAHLFQNYVASLVNVLHKPEPKYYSQAQ